MSGYFKKAFIFLILDGIRECSQKRNKIGSEDPDLEFSLPFLVGALKMVECLVYDHLVCPGEELSCSVRGYGKIYHINCVKEAMELSNKIKSSAHDM
ncbi:hypothetical protein AHAS_Ahas05G0117700 [Arachis hypogaea]